MSEAVRDVTGITPSLATDGGTSDARFIKNYCPVVEFGLVGQTMHAVDERTPVADLEKLAARARSEDHEVLLQVPMEPFDFPDNDLKMAKYCTDRATEIAKTLGIGRASVYRALNA